MLWFSGTLWPTLVLCAVLYVLDYYLTIAGAKLYRAGAQQMIVFEGSYELTPQFQADIDQLRLVSKRFIWALIRMLVLVSLSWWLTLQANIPQLFSVYLGVIIGTLLVVQKRHFHNLFLFRAIMQPGAALGQIRYSRGLILRQSAFEMLTFAAFFALLAVFTWSLFLLGCAVGCASVSIRHFITAKRVPNPTAAAEVRVSES